MGLYKNNSGTLAPLAGTPTNVISDLQNGIDQIANNTTKNLLPNKASSYHTNPRTISGVTFTINDDGSVTTSGTNTSGGDINYAINSDILFLNDCGPYILSGFPSGLSDNSYLGIYNPNIAWYAASKSNPEVTVDATLETGSYVCILLRSSYTGTYTWKPMIRPVGVDDNTYQPYAMTNRELTDSIGALGSLISVGTVTYNSVIDASSSSISFRKIADGILFATANIVPSNMSATIPAGTTLVTISDLGNITINDAPFAIGRSSAVFHGYFSRTNNTNEAVLKTSEAITGTQIRFCTVFMVTRV